MNKKTIWITGASTGIGKALAIKFAENGWNVAASARRENLLKELNDINENIHSYPLDVNKIDDCKSQRNLNLKGINQSKKIGKLFKKNKIPIDQVLSSQWCRCKDTAKYAFGEYKEFMALNSTFQSPYDKNEVRQLKELYSFVNKWNGKGKNLVLVTHYSIITAVTNSVPSSGEIIIADKNFKIISAIATD